MPLHPGLDCAQHRQLSAGELESAAGHGAIEAPGFDLASFCQACCGSPGPYLCFVATHAQKPPRLLPSTARAVAFCIEVRCVERCSSAVPLLIWTNYLNLAAGALPVCRANDPRCCLSVTGADAVQASVAVLWCDSCAKKGDPCEPPLWCRSCCSKRSSSPSTDMRKQRLGTAISF